MMPAALNDELAARSNDGKRGQTTFWAILPDAFPLPQWEHSTAISSPPRRGAVRSRKPSLISIQNKIHHPTSRPTKDIRTSDGKSISRAVFDSILNLDDAGLEPIIHFMEGLTCHFGGIFPGILHGIAHLAQVLPTKELPHRRLKIAEEKIHRSLRLLRRLEQAVSSSGDTRDGIHDRSHSDGAVFDMLFCRTIRCRSTRALERMDHLSAPTILKLLSSTAALHLHRALRSIHGHIVQAVNGEKKGTEVIDDVKRIHRLVHKGIYICDFLTDYGGCRKPEFKSLDIPTLIRDCLDRYRSCYHPLTIRTEMTREAAFVKGNEKQLRKMVLGMIDQAAGLIPKPHQLRIIVKRSADRGKPGSRADASHDVTIQFCHVNQFDLANSRHQLIHPFCQIARSRPQVAIGLAAAVGIANRHNGALKIATSREGSVLSIILPVTHAPRDTHLGKASCEKVHDRKDATA